MPPQLKQILFTYWQTIKHLQKHNGPFLSAALSYQTIFVISPLLFFIVNLLSLVLDNQEVSQFLLGQLRQFYGDLSVEVVEVILQNTRQWGNVWWLNLIFAGFFLLALNGFLNQINYSFNQIWENQQHFDSWKGVLEQQALHLLIVLGVVSLFFIITILNLVLSNVFAILPTSWVPAEILNQLFFILLFSGLLLALAKILIYPRPKTKTLIWGSLHASILFTLGKLALSWYFGQSNLLSLYGASSSLVVLLIWINFSAQTVFFGLALAKVLENKPSSSS